VKTEHELRTELEGNLLSIEEAFIEGDFELFMTLKGWRRALQWTLNELDQPDTALRVTLHRATQTVIQKKEAGP